VRRLLRERPRLIAAACWALGLCLWCGFIVLSVHYSFTRPHHPDPGAGRIYEHNMHGSFTYLTSGEHWQLRLLGIGGFALCCGGLVLSRRPSPGYDKARATYTDKTAGRSGSGS